MFRVLIGPVIIGILVFLFIFYISPVIISESDTVALVAGFTLDLSNLYFDRMPPVVASYVANLNLATIALTVGILATLAIQLVAIICSMFIGMAKWIISILPKGRKKDVATDLPPIDMDPGFKSPEDGNKVLGRGLDSIDRD